MVEFPRNALSTLRKLRTLNLDRNQLINLPNYAFQVSFVFYIEMR
jgi:Leucine-rich repeat (LRR) protein